MGREIWQRYMWVWLLPLIFCVVGLLGLFVYQGAFAGNVEDLQKDYEITQADLDEITEERERTEEVIARIETSQENIRLLYSDHFGTEAERFTAAVREIKKIANQAGLRPDSWSYPTEELAYGLTHQRVLFSVVGTYDQMRLFINFLELDEQFLTLEAIALSDSGMSGNNPQLSLRFEVSTVFQESDPGSSQNSRRSSRR